MPRQHEPSTRTHARSHAHARTHASTLPGVLDWRKNVASGGMWNTPATLNIWSTGKVAHWMEAEGGLDEMARRAAAKAAALYDAIEGSAGFYATPVAAPAERSRMNVPFSVRGGEEEATHAFLRETYEQNMVRPPSPCFPALSCQSTQPSAASAVLAPRTPDSPTHPLNSEPRRSTVARWASAR